MEVICVTVMLLLLLCRVEVTPVPTENTLLRYQTTTQSIRNFRAGDTVDLSCNKNHRDRTMWYGQKSNRAPFIIISAEMTLKHSERPSMKFYWGYNSRINVTWNRTNNSISLTIKNINESDEGFYFCTVGDGIFTTPGSGHILTLEESHSTSTQTPVSTTEQKTSSGDSEQCGTTWTLVMVFCCTTMLLTALVILVIQKNRRRGSKTSHTGQRVHQVEKLEEDEVQYSALSFSKPK